QDPEKTILDLLNKRMTEKAWEEVTDDDGVVHRLWVIHKKEFIMPLREAMKDRKLFIADGHSRYETAVNFRNQMRRETGKKDGKQPFDFMMMYLTNVEQDGLVILPTHRLFSRNFVSENVTPDSLDELRENFDMQESKVNLSEAEAEAPKVCAAIASPAD